MVKCVTSINYEGKNLTYFPSDGFFDKTTKDFLADKLRGGRGFDKTHTRLTTNISADRVIVKSSPLCVSKFNYYRNRFNKDNLYYIEQQYSPGSGRKRKRRVEKEKLKKIKEKITKKKKTKRYDEEKNNSWMEKHNVTFNEEFVNDDNNANVNQYD